MQSVADKCMQFYLFQISFSGQVYNNCFFRSSGNRWLENCESDRLLCDGQCGYAPGHIYGTTCVAITFHQHHGIVLICSL